jgi:hypothetical protein
MGILCSRNNKVNDLLNCLPTYGFYKNYIDQDNTGYLYLELPEIWQKEKNSFIDLSKELYGSQIDAIKKFSKNYIISNYIFKYISPLSVLGLHGVCEDFLGNGKINFKINGSKIRDYNYKLSSKHDNNIYIIKIIELDIIILNNNEKPNIGSIPISYFVAIKNKYY